MPDDEAQSKTDAKTEAPAPKRGAVYTDVMGNELEGDELERVKARSSIGRPVSKGDPGRNTDVEPD